MNELILLTSEAVEKDVLGNFAKFTGKQLCQSIFFNKAAVETGLSKHLK